MYEPFQNPDNVDAANESFRELAAAYQILSNPQSREKYDDERLGRRGDPNDFDFDDFDGAKTRRRVYKNPKPAYDTYGGHGEGTPNFDRIVNGLIDIFKAKLYAAAALAVAAAIVWVKLKIG